LADLQIPINSADPKYARPLPIVNTTLNVVRGKELALQTRKAHSFAITRLYGGFTRQSKERRDLQSFFGLTNEAVCRWPG
jgi:hypothetical protein